MGNVIYSDIQTGIQDDLYMSNGLTNVFINVLLLSGSQLAKQESEKEMIVWLAEKDQSAVGGGTVGFSVLDMPWNIKTFEHDRDFLLQVIEYAKDETLWEGLDYQPSKKLLVPKLEHFSELISQIKCSDIKSDSLEEWLAEATENDPVKCGFPRCTRHNTLLTIFGCQICNN